MSKNIFVYSNTPLWDVHYAEAIEIANEEYIKGNKVYFYQCKGELIGCPSNSFQDQKECKKCIEISNNVIKKILNFVEVVNFKFDNISVPKEIKEKYFSSVQELCNFHYDGFPIGGLVTSEMAGNNRDAFFDTKLNASRINSLLVNGYNLYVSTLKIIQSKRLDSVYVWNGRRSSDGPVVYAAKKTGKKFYTYISGVRLGEYVVVNGETIHNLSHYKALIANNLKAFEANDSVLNESLIAKGIKFYEYQRFGSSQSLGLYNFSKDFKSKFKQKTSKPVLSIFTSSLWEKIGQKEFDNKLYLDEYSGIIKLISNQIITNMYEIVIRFHPNLKYVGHGEGGYIKYISENFAGKITIFDPDSDIDSYTIIDESDIVVSFGSTIGIEAAYYGKKTICLGPAIYEDLNIGAYPSSHTELESLLMDSSMIKTPSKRDALIFGASMYRRGAHSFKHIIFRGETSYFKDGYVRIIPFSWSNYVKKKFESFANSIINSKYYRLLA